MTLQRPVRAGLPFALSGSSISHVIYLLYNFNKLKPCEKYLIIKPVIRPLTYLIIKLSSIIYSFITKFIGHEMS